MILEWQISMISEWGIIVITGIITTLKYIKIETKVILNHNNISLNKTLKYVILHCHTSQYYCYVYMVDELDVDV